MVFQALSAVFDFHCACSNILIGFFIAQMADNKQGFPNMFLNCSEFLKVSNAFTRNAFGG